MSVIPVPETSEAPLFSFDTTASCLLRMRHDSDLEIAAARRKAVGAGGTAAVSYLISVASEFGFHAEHARLDWQDLQKSRPGDRILALLKNGNVVILICGERGDEEIAVWDPLNRKGGVFAVDRRSLEANWDGHALIMTQRQPGQETASNAARPSPEPVQDIRAEENSMGDLEPVPRQVSVGPGASLPAATSEARWALVRRLSPSFAPTAPPLSSAASEISKKASRGRGLIRRLAVAVFGATASFGIVYLLYPAADEIAAKSISLIATARTFSQGLAARAEPGSSMGMAAAPATAATSTAPVVPSRAAQGADQAASADAAPAGEGTAAASSALARVADARSGAAPADPAAAASPPYEAEGIAIGTPGARAPRAVSTIPAVVLSDEADAVLTTGATVPLITRAASHSSVRALASIQQDDAMPSIEKTAPQPGRDNVALCGGAFPKVLDEAGSPEAYRSFVGIWAGRWPNGTCAGLIVSKIAADRTADITYLYRNNGIAGPKLYHEERVASIEADGKLYFQDEEGGRCIVAPVNKNRLTVTYITKMRKFATIVFERQS
jgi:hypothetical protein